MAILVQSNKKPSVSYPEQTGSIVIFNSQYAGLPLKSCVVDIPVTQEGTGDPSPDNVRNFVGVDSLDFSATGRNIFPPISTFPYTASSNTYFLDFAAKGTARKIPTIHLQEGVEYTLSFDVTVDNEPFNISVGAGSGAYSRDVKTVTGLSSGRVSVTFTPTASNLQAGDILAFRCPRYGSAQQFTFTIDNVQLEYGGLTDYQPFGNNKLFTFGQTIYAGELDVLTGIFTTTHKLAIFDGSEDEDWVKSTSYSGGYYYREWVWNNSISFGDDHIQNIGTTVSNLTDYSNGTNVCYFDRSLNFKVDNGLYPTISDFRNFLSQNNLQIWYPLPTPEVINIGGMNIETLQGENNLFASTGDTTASFIKIGG